MAADRFKADRKHTDVARETRIEDYLNDKLQDRADLSTIDSLLEDLNKQQALLSHQLQESKAALRSANEESLRHQESLRERTKAFKAQQSDIDRRLLIVTQSDTSDEAIQKFEGNMKILQRLDVAQGYIKLLAKVEDLTSEARRNFDKSPQEALQPYLKLQNIVQALRAAQPAAEDAAPHLVDHVGEAARSLWKQMKEVFASDFEKTLKKMRWPGKDIELHDQLKFEWSEGVKRLLELQEPELLARENEELDSQSKKDPLALLPLEVMMKPLELRFKYHFEGDRPTNKIEKPEYFLSHAESLLNTYETFFTLNLQPILREQYRSTQLTSRSIYIDSTSAFITSILPMLRRKIFATIPSLSKQPQLLSHFIHELMGFDVRLRDEWEYDAGNRIQGWKGLTWEVLVKKGWFNRWLEVEKTFALNRYQDIINAPESHEIDYDSVETGVTKPTNAAVRVNDLLETITDRYRPLASFSQKLQFLIDIQIEIFDSYHNRLFDSLSKYQVSSSSIGRTIQGESRESAADVSGLKGIELLCRVFGSAEYLEKKMRDWSDDVFFLELYDELQDRISSRPGKPIAGPMSVEAVAERTSSTVDPSNNNDATDTGALFDETAGSYRRLRIRAENLLIDSLTSTFREILRPYGRINPWSSLATPSFEQSQQLALTAELDATVQTIHSHFSLLGKILARAPLRRIGRQVALAIQAFLWDSVLMRYTFSATGIAQFTRDVEVIWDSLDRYLGPGQGAVGMRRLREALMLMGLPAGKGPYGTSASPRSVGGHFDDRDDDDEGEDKENRREVGVQVDDRDDDDEGEDEEDRQEVGLGLWEVEKRVFRDNEGAREVLEELGLETLSEMDARNVMKRIIEIGDE